MDNKSRHLYPITMKLSGSSKLNAWLAAHHVAKKEFAKRLQISRQYLSAICYGKKKPSVLLIRIIDIETQGEVSPEEWS